MHKSVATIIASATFMFAAGANAQTAGNLLGAPVVTAGGLVSTAAAGHARIAPIVNRLSPTVEPVTDGVTNALAAAGAGVTSTGQSIQSNGLQVGSTSSGQPLVSVGKTQASTQGSVAALLNGRR